MSADKPRILIVDDDDDLRSLYELRLQGVGYEVLTASSGRTGIAEAHRMLPHLILLDVIMPGESGLETLKKIRLDPVLFDTAVCILTTDGQKASVREAGTLNVQGYFLKSISFPALLEKIEEELDQLGVELPSSPPESDMPPPDRVATESSNEKTDSLRWTVANRSEMLRSLSIIELQGKVEKRDMDPFLNFIDDQIQKGKSSVVLDLAETRWSMWIANLVRLAAAKALERKGVVRVVTRDNHIKGLLAQQNIGVTIADTVDDAVRDL